MIERLSAEEAFERTAKQIMDNYLAALDEIREDMELDDIARLELAEAARENATRQRAAAIATRNRALEAREAQLRKELFGASGPGFTEAVSRASLALEEDLQEMAELASLTGDKTLGKAVFVVAHNRGMSDLALEYINSNPGVQAQYRELAEMPTAEQRQRLEDNPDIPQPGLDMLRPRTSDIQRAERVETSRRAENASRIMGGY